MSRELDLSEEDMLVLQKCLNDGVEPPHELANKLFPSLYATFDFKTIKDSKIPTIAYQGKCSEAAILNEAAAFGGGSPLHIERCFDGSRSMHWCIGIALSVPPFAFSSSTTGSRSSVPVIFPTT